EFRGVLFRSPPLCLPCRGSPGGPYSRRSPRRAWSRLHQTLPSSSTASERGRCMPQWAQRTMDSTGWPPGRRAGARGGWLALCRLWAARAEATRAIIMTARMMMTQINSLPTSAPMKNHFQHEPAAGVGQDQEGESGEGPAQRHAPAPATDVAAQQQHAEGDQDSSVKTVLWSKGRILPVSCMEA